MPRPADQMPPAPDRDWLTLGVASRLLGVNADSLRRWADEGRVPCITTPGGHRRFARDTLDALLEPAATGAGRDVRSSGGSRLAPDQSRVTSAYRQSYLTDGRSGATERGSDATFARLDRDAFRTEGRRLVDALLGALEAGDDDARSEAEASAMGIAAAHARRLADADVPLADAVRLFVRARRPFLDEIRALAHRRRLDPAAVLAVYGDASALLDRLLVAFVAAHASPSPTITPPVRSAPTAPRRDPELPAP